MVAFGPGGHRQIHGGTGFGGVRCNLTARYLPNLGRFGHPTDVTDMTDMTDMTDITQLTFGRFIGDFSHFSHFSRVS